MNEESEFTALTKYFYFAPIYMSFLFFTQVTFFFCWGWKYPFKLIHKLPEVKKFILLSSYSKQPVLKHSPANVGDTGDMSSYTELGRFPWKSTWQPTPVFLSG